MDNAKNPIPKATETPVVKPKENDVALTKNKGFARAMNAYMKGQRVPRRERRKYIATKGWLNNNV